MWTSVLVLALALNFEPTRFALVPMLLSRRNPVAQLLAYVVGATVVNVMFGLLILFVFRRNPLGTNASTGGWVQIVVGALALTVGLIMALRWKLARRRESAAPASSDDPEKTRGVDKVFVGARAILRKGGSPWFAGLLGMGVGLPSVDFMAVLVIIATSHKPPLEQTAALLTFVFVGGGVVMLPLITYLFAPERTLARIDRFAAWAKTRSQIEYGAVLAIAGAILVVVGFSRL